MPIVERSTVIHAPVGSVFGVMDDATRLPEYMPGITRVANVVRTPRRVGDSYRVTYTVLGLRFPTKIKVLEWEENKRYVEKMEGSMPGTFSYLCEPQGEDTKVTWKIEYSMPGGILGNAVNRLLLERMNEKTAERGLENLKMICEAQREAKVSV